MDSLEQWIFDIGRHVGALEAENEALSETIEELEAKDPSELEAALEGTEACHLDALDQIEELERDLVNMTRSRDWFRRQYDELLQKPVPHDELVSAAEKAISTNSTARPQPGYTDRYGNIVGYTDRYKEPLSGDAPDFDENWSYD